MQRLVDIAPPEIHAVWGVLSAIPDPEVPVLTITDLGMVRSVERRGEGWSLASRQPTPAARPPNICWGRSAR